MDLAALQKLIRLCRANGVTHLNTTEIELRFTLDAGQTIAPVTGELGEVGELTAEEESEVEPGTEDPDDESDESIVAQLARANFDPGGKAPPRRPT